MIFEYIKLLFDAVWELFQIEYPGLYISFGGIALGALCVTLSLRLLGKITGASFTPGWDFKRIQGGNNRNIKVSDERKGDTH